MTSDRLDETVEHAVAAARDDRGHRRIWLAGALMILGILVFATVYLIDRSTLQSTVDQLTARSDSSEAAARALAEQVRALGAAPVVSPPSQPPPPPARGISGTSITGGRLLVAYTDGKVEDKGVVVGADGKDGTSPPGIVSSSVVDGALVLRWSDGRTEVAGRVVGEQGAAGAPGADGRGVRSVTVAEGRLVVTYTDGTTSDAGPVPTGPAGPPGPAGRGIAKAEVYGCRWLVTYTDGTTADAGNACTTKTVTADPTSATKTPGRK